MGRRNVLPCIYTSGGSRVAHKNVRCFRRVRESALRKKVACEVIVVEQYPLPSYVLRRFLQSHRNGVPAEVLEHGDAFVTSMLREQAFGAQSTTGGITRYSPPIADHTKRYITHAAGLEMLFTALQDIKPDALVGDIGQYTSEKSITSALCMGSAVSVCLGIAEARRECFPFCVTGDAALLHAGGITLLNEVRSRGARMCIIVIDNGGSVSTDGQFASVGLQLPDDAMVVHYRKLSSSSTLSQLLSKKKVDGEFSVVRLVID